jgi:hypothetical protein
VVLLNGKRVSSYAGDRRIPTEAIERTEVFPEELALKYGYRADQKVVNVVTFERFNSKVGQMPTPCRRKGGRDTVGINANYLRIRNNTRFNLDADYSRSGSLLESERDVLQVAELPTRGGFRTLVPSSERLALNGTVSGTVLEDVSATLNGRFETLESDSLLGLGPSGALERETDMRTAHLGTALGGLMGKMALVLHRQLRSDQQHHLYRRGKRPGSAGRGAVGEFACQCRSGRERFRLEAPGRPGFPPASAAASKCGISRAARFEAASSNGRSCRATGVRSRQASTSRSPAGARKCWPGSATSR